MQGKTYGSYFDLYLNKQIIKELKDLHINCILNCTNKLFFRWEYYFDNKIFIDILKYLLVK